MCNFMKTGLIILFALFLTSSAFADCEDTGIRVFPEGETLGQNSIIVLEGYAESQKIILGLNKKYPVYFKSGEKKVNLMVKEICIGQYYLTQALLTPETKLESGLEYTLCIDSLPNQEAFTRYNYKSNKLEFIKYKVVDRSDTDNPILLSKPKVLKKILEFYGCGDVDFVVFDFHVKDSSDLIIKTIVKNLASGKESAYYLEPRNNQIYVGHDMCSGAFVFDNSSKYEVEFSILDTSGNLTLWTGERIKFTKPTNKMTH